VFLRRADRAWRCANPLWKGLPSWSSSCLGGPDVARRFLRPTVRGLVALPSSDRRTPMRTVSKLIAAAALAAPLFAVAPAAAQEGLAACGNIEVSASAKCEVEVDCEAQCTPIAFEAQCWAKGEATCAGECDGSFPTVECEAECTGGCEAE